MGTTFTGIPVRHPVVAFPKELLPVTYPAERPGSGAISFTKSGCSGTRKWQVPWDGLPGGGGGTESYTNYVVRLLGMTISGPNSLPQISYPAVFGADFPWLYCQEVDVEGEDSYGMDFYGRIRYRRAILTAKYMPIEQGESFSLSAQVLSLPQGTFNYVGTPASFFGTPPKLDMAEIRDYQAKLKTFQQAQANQNAQLQQIRDFNADPVDAPAPDPQNIFAAPGNNPIGDPAAVQNIQDQLNKGLLFGGDIPPKPNSPLNITKKWQDAYTAWQQAYQTAMFVPGLDDATFQSHTFPRVAANTTVNQPMTKIVPMGEYSLDRSQVLAPDFWGYIAMLGCINANFFVGFPPWTLLFSGMEAKRNMLPNGTRSWNITFKFHFNPNTWNCVYRAETSEWQLVACAKMAQQTFWTFNQAPVGAFKKKGGGATGLVAGLTTDSVHGFLYVPADFSGLLAYR